MLQVALSFEIESISTLAQRLAEIISRQRLDAYGLCLNASQMECIGEQHATDCLSASSKADLGSTDVQLRGKTGSPLRPDAALYPSSPEAYQAVLAKLSTDSETVDVWIDRFREWLSKDVFKPLAKHMMFAHQVSNFC